MGTLTDFVDEWRRRTAGPQPTAIPEEPAYLHGIHRAVQRCPPPVWNEERQLSLHRFRSHIAGAMRDYMAERRPDYMLLIPAPPGTGKSWAGVEFAHWVHAQSGKRVLYAGPRHDFYADLIRSAAGQGQDTALWLEWLPRQTDEDDPQRNTCLHAGAIADWSRKEHDSMAFCRRICGWNYVEDGCLYHAQKRRSEPLIFGQHAHLTLGHPLADEIEVALGDELPLTAFLHERRIPKGEMAWNVLPVEEPLAEILYEMERLSRRSLRLHGPALLAALGGAEHVLAACELMPPDLLEQHALAAMHRIRSPADAQSAPANFLGTFTRLLRQEARAALDLEDYLERIYLTEDGLTLLTRRSVSDGMPAHLIWFDATGTPGLYEAMFERPVRVLASRPAYTGRIFQVTDRANGKASLLPRPRRGARGSGQQGLSDQNTSGQRRGDEGGRTREMPTTRAGQIRAQIDHIAAGYRRTAVITFQGLAPYLAQDTAHFYGSRGTNQFQTYDCLVVAGTPSPPPAQIEKMARMLWPQRMERYDARWIVVDRTYRYVDENGDGWQYPISVFADRELSELLWQFREGEIVQAAHRTRLLWRNTDVYLLTNLPIDELPPARLLSIRALFDAPDGVDVFLWRRIVQYAEKKTLVGTVELVEEFGVHAHTARKYVRLLADRAGWQAITLQPGRGRPQLAAQTRHRAD